MLRVIRFLLIIGGSMALGGWIGFHEGQYVVIHKGPAQSVAFWYFDSDSEKWKYIAVSSKDSQDHIYVGSMSSVSTEEKIANIGFYFWPFSVTAAQVRRFQFDPKYDPGLGRR